MDNSSVGTPLLWGVTIGFVVALVVGDFLLTRRPHEVSTREAAWWSAFYVAIPLAFGGVTALKSAVEQIRAAMPRAP